MTTSFTVSTLVGLALTCGCGSESKSGSDRAGSAAQPTAANPTAGDAPPPTAEAGTNKVAPEAKVVTPTPFEERTLQPSKEPMSPAGKLRKLSTIRPKTPIFIWGTYAKPARIVTGIMAGKEKPERWELLDGLTGAKLSDLGKPRDKLEREIIASTSAMHSGIVHIEDGSVLAPDVQVPNGGRVESVSILTSDGNPDTWLLASTSDKAYVGLWNDRVPKPTLPHEIPTFDDGAIDALDDGLAIHPHDSKRVKQPDGELKTERLELACKRIRLQRSGVTCDKDVPYPDPAEVYGGWRISAMFDEAVSVHELATGAQQTFELPCDDRLRVSVASIGVPRVLANCRHRTTAEDVWTWWSPDAVHTFQVPSTNSTLRMHFARQRIVSVANLQFRRPPIGGIWFDVQAGIVYRSPEVQDLTLSTASRFVAVQGTGAARRAVILDFDAATIRDVAPFACTGGALATLISERYTVLVCAVENPNAGYKLGATKLIDLKTNRYYDIPGHPEEVFDDNTLLVSNKRQHVEESYLPVTELQLFALE